MDSDSSAMGEKADIKKNEREQASTTVKVEPWEMGLRISSLYIRR